MLSYSLHDLIFHPCLQLLRLHRHLGGDELLHRVPLRVNSTLHVLDSLEPEQRAVAGSWTAKAVSLAVLLPLLLSSGERGLRRVSYYIERTG